VYLMHDTIIKKSCTKSPPHQQYQSSSFRIEKNISPQDLHSTLLDITHVT
jgi:hypothetical protein